MRTLAGKIKFAAITGVAVMMGVSGFNSYKFSHSNHLVNDFNIKLTKRLDETYGRVKFGRMAASLRKSSTRWNQNNVDKKIQAKVTNAVRKQFQPLLDKKVAVKPQPAPAIANDLDLELTGGIFNKKPLKDGVDFSGDAKVVDGVIEEINVSLPGGKEFSINTRERMVGNVFQYEDTKTREIRSGLFYEVKKGTYMITLTDDSQYGGVRLQFSAPQEAEVKFGNEQNMNWGMNNQNNNSISDAYADRTESGNDFVGGGNEPDESSYAEPEQDDYAFNDEEEVQEDAYEAQRYEDIQETTEPYSHSF